MPTGEKRSGGISRSLGDQYSYRDVHAGNERSLDFSRSDSELCGGVVWQLVHRASTIVAPRKVAALRSHRPASLPADTDNFRSDSAGGRLP